ncbi:hypothetical protein NA63_2696 [Flavobacteriaceae bacterium MAR_2010_105]|nr:hypothetical protein NA63_2696 [Flavobacteriaceae bacterium MAR_2010_105]
MCKEFYHRYLPMKQESFWLVMMTANLLLIIVLHQIKDNKKNESKLRIIKYLYVGHSVLVLSEDMPRARVEVVLTSYACVEAVHCFSIQFLTSSESLEVTKTHNYCQFEFNPEKSG